MGIENFYKKEIDLRNELILRNVISPEKIDYISQQRLPPLEKYK